MRGFLVDVRRGKTRVVETDGGIKSIRNLCKCKMIDVQLRKIGGKPFVIVCDEEGAHKADCKVTAIDTDGNPMFVGNLLILKSDKNNNVLGLDDEDIETIRANTKYRIFIGYGAVPYVRCEY